MTPPTGASRQRSTYCRSLTAPRRSQPGTNSLPPSCMARAERKVWVGVPALLLRWLRTIYETCPDKVSANLRSLLASGPLGAAIRFEPIDSHREHFGVPTPVRDLVHPAGVVRAVYRKAHRHQASSGSWLVSRAGGRWLWPECGTVSGIRLASTSRPDLRSRPIRSDFRPCWSCYPPRLPR